MNDLKAVASQYLGELEIAGNQGFEKKKLQQRMHAVGWEKGDAWCILFAELCVDLYLTQFNTGTIRQFDKTFSKSAVATFNNFKKQYPEMISHVPVENSIVIWQKYIEGNAMWQGHAGIVNTIHETYITTIEGNTGSASMREGDGVHGKLRTLDYDKENGLRLIGFISFNNLV